MSTTASSSSVTTSSTTTSSTSAVAVTRRSRAGVALGAARILLALFFAFGAVAKLMAHESAVESFDRMGWGSGAMYAIGGLEGAGAIALLIPLLSGVAAMAFVGLLAGASVVQLTLLDPPNAVMPAVLIVVVVLIARDRRERTAQLVGLVRRRA